MVAWSFAMTPKSNGEFELSNPHEILSALIWAL